MYMYIYIYTYTKIYTHIRIQICICIRIYMNVHIYKLANMPIHTNLQKRGNFGSRDIHKHVINMYYY